jgi:hypothetical protein
VRRRNPFPEGLRDEVLDRDRVCFLKRLDPRHQCRTIFGLKHASDDRRFLTLDHVKKQLALGLLKRHKPWFLVAMCGMENNRPPTQATRMAERTYLATLYPSEWGQ